MGTSYLLAKSSTTMKMHLGLLVVLAGLAMGQKGQRGKTEKRVRQEPRPSIARIGGSGGLSQEGCFPGPPLNACPPIKNLRIVNQKYSNWTLQKTYDDCWQYCKALASNSNEGCNAWTYSTTSMGCFAYNSFPACYNTEEYEGWISGRDHCN